MISKSAIRRVMSEMEKTLKYVILMNSDEILEVQSMPAEKLQHIQHSASPRS